MNEKNNRKLDAMSHIDDELIEKSTQKRIFLLKRAKKRKTRRNIFISVGASAASFFMILGVILAVILLFSNIPVYTGMTVSGEPPVVAGQESVAMPKIYPRTGVTAGAMRVTPFTALTGGLDLLSEETTDVFEETSDVFEETTDVFEEYTDIFEDHTDTSEETTDASEKRKIAYHATVGQDIYITIHIDNPENFAILQFTLNGKVYNSYMFEEGSDMENLVLKYNVGNEIGYFDYTIDAIKYVDGTEIKDVRMDGDRTIKIGVGPSDERDLPSAKIFQSSTEWLSELEFDVNVFDSIGLIERAGGRVYCEFARVENGTRYTLDERELQIAKGQKVKFDGVSPETFYQLCVYAEFDAFDGSPFTHSLAMIAVRTEPLVDINWHFKLENVDVVQFDLSMHKGVTIEKSELVRADDDSDVVLEIAGDERVFENVPAGSYKVKTTCSFDGDNGKQTESFFSDVLTVFVSGIAFEGTPELCVSNYSFYDWDRNTYVTLLGQSVTPADADGRVFSATDGVIVRAIDDVVAVRFTIDRYKYTIYYVGLELVPTELEKGSEISAGDYLGVAKSHNYCDVETPHVHIMAEGWTAPSSRLFEEGYFIFTEGTEHPEYEGEVS